MKKKDLFRIASMFIMILLLPLFLALMCVVDDLIISPSLKPSIQMAQAFRVIICGIPILIIIAYGYITKNKITSTLSGVFLIPLSFFYIDILSDLADPYFISTREVGWLRWIVSLSNPLFMPICGLAGYFASRGTKISLSIAIFFGILFIFIMLGID